MPACPTEDSQVYSNLRAQNHGPLRACTKIKRRGIATPLVGSAFIEYASARRCRLRNPTASGSLQTTSPRGLPEVCLYLPRVIHVLSTTPEWLNRFFNLGTLSQPHGRPRSRFLDHQKTGEDVVEISRKVVWVRRASPFTRSER